MAAEHDQHELIRLLEISRSWSRGMPMGELENLRDTVSCFVNYAMGGGEDLSLADVQDILDLASDTKRQAQKILRRERRENA
jgi:hypothetical protein